MGPLGSHAPGAGRRRPRAYLRSDAPVLGLNGRWDFRLDDGPWTSIAVPGHWQLQGHGRPAYTNTRYPFPVDPPFVPDENPTGEYRRAFDLPAHWPVGDDAVLRFLGVDSAFTAWLNGTELGWSTGSRLTTEFDVGHLVRPAGNLLTVRVHQWSPGSYLEDQDQWWLSGIFRDVTVLARPAGSVDDVFVHAGYDHVSGAGTLLVDTDLPGLLDVPELGIEGLPCGERLRVPSVEPWSAEAPRLYSGYVRAGGETITVRIGFRSVAVTDGQLLVNGRPILLRGVNRHEWNPDRGRSVTAEDMRRDVELMKQHNINAVRTSHYPPHPLFLDLCDEYGLYVVDECDLETHGFLHVDWRQNPSDDARWAAALLDRMQRTVERDKNHASVIMWSLGNESGHGSNLAAMAAWTRERDPERPLHYEGDSDSGYVDVYSRMYPTHTEVDAIGRHAEPVTDDPALDDHRRGLPFVLCEYAHAMGNGPGGLSEYQDLFEKYPRCQGGFVWEWIDHGIRQRTPDGREYFAYGGDFGEALHDGNFVCDGLLFPDRTASPGLAEVKSVFAPVRLEFAGSQLLLTNLRDHADTSDLRFLWTHEVEGVPVADGELAVVPVAPRERISVPVPALERAHSESWLTVRAVLAKDALWAGAGHEVAAEQVRVSPAARTRLRGSAPPRELFDASTGLLTLLGAFPVRGPRLDVWRAPTDNDRGEHEHPAVAWQALGLHRMTHRVLDRQWTDDAFVLRSRVAPAATDVALLATYRWAAAGETLRLEVSVQPEGEWTVSLPRLGLRMALPASLAEVEWFGLGPGEAYSDSRRAALVGRYRASIEELQTPYVFPQENGNRRGVRWAELRGPDGGVRVEGEPHVDLTVRRWTSEDLAAARHTADLVDRGAVYVNLDHAQHGLGSASCGPGVLPQHVLSAEPATWTVRLIPLR